MLCKLPATAFLSFAFLMSSGINATAVENNTVPQAVHQALDKGPVNPDEEMTITVHLVMTNKPAFDKAVDDLYDPASANYEHWMTDADFVKYAPSPAALPAVKTELLKSGLSVVEVDPLGFYIRVHGTVAAVQKAFNTELHEYTLKGKTFRAETLPPHLAGGADAYIYAIAGLTGSQGHPLAKQAVNAKTSKGPKAIPTSKLAMSDVSLGSLMTDNCFTGPTTYTFDTPGSTLPVGVYVGNVYNVTATTQVCGFTSKQLQEHYGLPAAYKKGYDGTGATVALVEAYGYPSIETDANEFSALNGLPELTSKTFEIVYPEGKPQHPELGPELGWDVENALDVQWAHTIAPKAKILEVISPSQTNEDFQAVIAYVAKNHLATSISNSWEADSEYFTGPGEVNSFNVVLEKAAAEGVSVNFSSGDVGDDGNGSPIGAPEVPADAPYATAVGGTAILNNFYGANIEVGWGSAQGELAFDGPFDPPFAGFFVAGAGGGESVYFDKPKWQAALPGTGRQVPDVSALSDPYTGVPIIVTQSGTQYLYLGYGGTSLGCPIFSAFWALANVAAGHSLGQAAPHLAKATGKQITDILPQTSVSNPSGIVIDYLGSTYYSPESLMSYALALGTATDFISGTWPNPFGYTGLYLTQAFGLDSSLTVTPGWDNVTGFGAPNGLAFIEGFK